MGFKYLRYLTLFSCLSLALALTSLGQDRPEVKEAQELLSEKGYDPGPADGLMGSKTRTAIMEFQKDRDLIVTGELDRVTLWELGILDEDNVPSRAKIRRLRVVAAETRIPVLLQVGLDSGTAQVGNSFSCTVAEPVIVGGAMAIPAGKVFNGRVADVHKASKSPHGGRLALRVETLELDESEIPVKGYLAVSKGDSDAPAFESGTEDSGLPTEGVSVEADPGNDVLLDPGTRLVLALASELRIPLE